MRRTKTSSITLTINGERTAVSIDRFTSSLIPRGVNRAAHVRDAVLTLWCADHPVSPYGPVSFDEAVKKLMSVNDTSLASIVQSAIAYTAGKSSEEEL